MARLLRLEVWTKFQCDGGTRDAVLALQDCSVLAGTERITREDVVSFTVPKASVAAASLSLGRVIRFAYDDGSFTEWRIHELVDASGRDGGTYRVSCRGLVYELRDLALIAATSGGVLSTAIAFEGKTATEVITALLAYLPGWWAVGTVAPTTAVSLSVASDATPLRVLRELVTTLNAAGDACELDIRRNGTTGYYIDLPSAIGATAGTADVRTAKNILRTDRTRSRETMANRIYPRGSDGASIEYAYWRVTSVAGNDVEVRQPESAAPAFLYDDQVNGLYLENDAGTRVLISDTVAATSKATVSSSAGFSANEWCRIVADASGTGILKVDYPLATSTKVQIVDGGETAVTNLLDNPYMSRWTGSTSAPPTGWQSGTTPINTYTRNATATYIRRGTYSLRCQTTAGGQSVRTTLQNILPGRGTTYSAMVDVYLVSGTWTVILRNQAGTSLASTAITTVGWNTVSHTGIGIGAATGLYLEILNTAGAPAECYVDSAQLTVGAAQSAWTLGSGPASLYRRALLYLEENAYEPTRYVFSVADLNRLSPTEWPYDELVLGGSVRITNTELGITTTSRITELTRNYLNPAETTLVLERTTRTLTTVLAAA